MVQNLARDPSLMVLLRPAGEAIEIAERIIPLPAWEGFLGR